MAHIVGRNTTPFLLSDLFPVGRKAFGNFCVYLHHKLDGTIFYVGKGLPMRPFSKARSKEWHNVAKDGYTVTILFSDMDNSLAEAVEKLLIKFIGIELLTNKTLGGGGALGYKHSEEHLARLSKAMSGEGNPMFGKAPHNAGKSCPEHQKEKMRKPRPEMAGDLNGASDIKVWNFTHKDGRTHVGTRCSLQRKYGITSRDTSKICVGGRKSSKGWSARVVES